jgi:N-acetylmuramoyl-L-alanine amidase
VGAFRQRGNADALVRQLAAQGFEAVVSLRDGLYKVQIGAFRDRADADKVVQALRSQRYLDVFVVQEELTSP